MRAGLERSLVAPGKRLQPTCKGLGAKQSQPVSRGLSVRRGCSAVWVLLTVAVGCSPSEEDHHPEFVEKLIVRFESGPKQNPPGSIWRYHYNGRVVFYVPPSCCDVPSALYDGDGNLICAPDGGLTGDGDGRCPDFFRARTQGSRVWVDGR